MVQLEKAVYFEIGSSTKNIFKYKLVSVEGQTK